MGEPHPFFAEFAPFLFHVVRVPAEIGAVEAALADLGGRVAGFLLEPIVQGAAGMKMHPVEFLSDLRSSCTKHGIFLLADEVMTGFGRTGHLFACNAAKIAPDILCLAKGLTGGIFPLSATLVKEEIYGAFLADERGKAFFHGHTYGGNPLACAVALASLDVFDEEKTLAKLPPKIAHLRDRLNRLREHPHVGDIRQRARLSGSTA